LPEWAEIAYLAAAGGLIGYMASSMFSSGALLETSYMIAAFALATSLILARDNRRDDPDWLLDDDWMPESTPAAIDPSHRQFASPS
jgi:hypothetical protein